MNKTLDDLKDDLVLQLEEAQIWLERRADADKERMIAHLSFVAACRAADNIRAEIISANGEPS